MSIDKAGQQGAAIQINVLYVTVLPVRCAAHILQRSQHGNAIAADQNRLRPG